MPMQNRLSLPRWAIPALIAVCCVVFASPAYGKGKNRGKPYIFKVTNLELKSGVPARLEAEVRKQIGVAIDDHDQLLSAIEEGAPDPEKEPEKFKKYLERRKQKAYKVNVEITSYSHEVEQVDRTRRLIVSVSMRMFGETIPQRVMAFTGDGAATIKIDIGKKLRKADSRYANEEAIKLAVADAISTSIVKLKAGPKKSKKKRRKRKK